VAKKDDPAGNLWIMGLALTLPMILLSGPLSGYLISYWLIRSFGFPAYLTPVLMGLGLFGSGIQCYGLIRKLNQSNKN